MKVKIIYEKPEGEGELALGIDIDQTIRKKFPEVKIEVEGEAVQLLTKKQVILDTSKDIIVTPVFKSK